MVILSGVVWNGYSRNCWDQPRDGITGRFGELKFLFLIELGSSGQALHVLLCVEVTVMVLCFVCIFYNFLVTFVVCITLSIGVNEEERVLRVDGLYYDRAQYCIVMWLDGMSKIVS